MRKLCVAASSAIDLKISPYRTPYAPLHHRLINVTPGCEAQLIASLTTLAEASRKEEGCIQYDMHLDNEDPSFIMFYETWASRDLWLEHMKSEHLYTRRL